jgi:hypothetical protein
MWQLNWMLSGRSIKVRVWRLRSKFGVSLSMAYPAMLDAPAFFGFLLRRFGRQ